MPELDWSESDMDKVVCLLCNDTKFLSRCVRKNIDYKLFSSDVRKDFVRTVCDYFNSYGRAPGDDLLEIVAKRIKSEEDKTIYVAYLEKLEEVQTLDISPDFLLDRIDHFIKKRIVINTTNKLLKLQDRFGVDPDRPLEIMREALTEIGRSVGDARAESILDDRTDFSLLPDTATFFGVPNLDRPLGGGLKFGDYVILLGFTNIGKSWLILHLAKMAVRLGVTPLYMPIEMNNRVAKLRVRQSFAGMRRGEVSNRLVEAHSAIDKAMLKKSNLFLLGEDEKMMKVSDMPFILDDIEERHGVRPRLILIDSADDLTAPEGRYDDKLERSTELHTWLKNYAKDEELCMVTTVQTHRRGKSTWWIDAGNTGDNFKKAQRATKGISICGLEDELLLGYRRLFLFKNSDGPVGSKSWVKVNFDIGQFVLDSGRYSTDEYREILSAAGKLSQEIRKILKVVERKE